MLIDKKSEGFENIEKRLANEVELFLLSLRLLGYLLFAIAYRVFSEWLYIKELKGALLHLTNYLQFMISRMFFTHLQMLSLLFGANSIQPDLSW